MIRMKRLEKAIPALHTIVVQLLSTTGSLKILASKGTRAEKTYQKFIAESSLCETQKDVTLLIQGTQSKHRNATSCDAKQEIIPKNLDKSGRPENKAAVFWSKHKFRNQVWSCERHWLVQTPAFGCSSFNCASRKSASSWASSAEVFQVLKLQAMKRRCNCEFVQKSTWTSREVFPKCWRKCYVVSNNLGSPEWRHHKARPGSDVNSLDWQTWISSEWKSVKLVCNGNTHGGAIIFKYKCRSRSMSQCQSFVNHFAEKGFPEEDSAPNLRCKRGI